MAGQSLHSVLRLIMKLYWVVKNYEDLQDILIFERRVDNTAKGMLAALCWRRKQEY